MKNNYHETVMLEEVVEGLHIKSKGRYIDATLGNAGHAEAILKKGGYVLGIEIDPEMLEVAKLRLEGSLPHQSSQNGVEMNFKVVNDSFVNIEGIAEKKNWIPVDGIIFDLGVNNIHLTDTERGFSFQNNYAPLDMRLNPKTQGVRGADLLNVLREDQLVKLFETVMEPGPARWITGRVIHSRAKKPIQNVGDLKEISRGFKVARKGLNEATLPFLALRIAVNSELENIKSALPKAFDILAPHGRIAVISFHSGEDEIVKSFYREMQNLGRGKVVTIKPIEVTEGERVENKRSRSAKLRILEKI